MTCLTRSGIGRAKQSLIARKATALAKAETSLAQTAGTEIKSAKLPKVGKGKAPMSPRPGAAKKVPVEAMMGAEAEGLASEASKLIDHKSLTHIFKKIDLGQFNIHPSIGKINDLKIFCKKFSKVKGAITKDGPLSKVLQCTEDTSRLGTARGAWYELEVASLQTDKGIEIIEFGQKILGTEFDIELANKLIECKNWDWSKQNISKVRSSLGTQLSKAKAVGKIFELHSKQAIPHSLQEWLLKKGIPFFEG